MRAFVQRFEDHSHRSPMHDSSSDSAKGSPFEEAPRIVAQRQTINGPANDGASSGGGSTLPHALTRGIAALSGMDVSDVMVHRNSPRPATVNALAVAQNNEIHLAPGQEKHLPHEAWHIVQQRQGRVAANMQEKGVDMNDEPGLEKEATVMGERALKQGEFGKVGAPVRPRSSAAVNRSGASAPLQRYPAFTFSSEQQKRDKDKKVAQKEIKLYKNEKSDAVPVTTIANVPIDVYTHENKDVSSRYEELKFADWLADNKETKKKLRVTHISGEALRSTSNKKLLGYDGNSDSDGSTVLYIAAKNVRLAKTREQIGADLLLEMIGRGEDLHRAYTEMPSLKQIAQIPEVQMVMRLAKPMVQHVQGTETFQKGQARVQQQFQQMETKYQGQIQSGQKAYDYADAKFDRGQMPQFMEGVKGTIGQVAQGGTFHQVIQQGINTSNQAPVQSTVKDYNKQYQPGFNPNNPFGLTPFDDDDEEQLVSKEDKGASKQFVQEANDQRQMEYYADKFLEGGRSLGESKGDLAKLGAHHLGLSTVGSLVHSLVSTSDIDRVVGTYVKESTHAHKMGWYGSASNYSSNTIALVNALIMARTHIFVAKKNYYEAVDFLVDLIKRQEVLTSEQVRSVRFLLDKTKALTY